VCAQRGRRRSSGQRRQRGGRRHGCHRGHRGKRRHRRQRREPGHCGGASAGYSRTPAKLEKVWAKVNDAVRVGSGIIFKAKLAVRSLGKSRLALAAAEPLNQLVSEAQAACTRFELLSMQNSDGTLAAQVDTAALLAEVKAFHALLQELQKGEKSALVLRGGR
jgi:hypothetical protein